MLVVDFFGDKILKCLYLEQRLSLFICIIKNTFRLMKMTNYVFCFISFSQIVLKLNAVVKEIGTFSEKSCDKADD